MGGLAEKLAGRFIVIDGPDGAGKSTQVRMLADSLGRQGLQPICVRDPGGTRIGEKIRQILLDAENGEMGVPCELMLYMASRAQLVSEVIAPALRGGRCVLGDRYVSSTVAYQCAGGLEVRHVQAVAEVAVAGVWPDLTIILDLPPEEGLARIKATPDRMESKDLDFHRQVRKFFSLQARENPQKMTIIDGTDSIAEVQEKILEALAGWRFSSK